MSSLPIFSTASRRYLWFILWGLVDGAVIYFVISETGGASYRGNIRILIPLVLCGGIISAVVFGLLLRFPRGLRAAGFLVVGAITPWLGIIGTSMLYCGCFDMYLSPLTAFAVLLWTAFSLPFSILSAAIYFFIRFLSRSQAKARSPSL